LSYTWNNNSTWNYASGLAIPQNQWSFAAVTIEPSRAILYLGNANQMQTATNAIAHSTEAWGGNVLIGSDGGVARVFNGILDEVALFNYTLSPQQVLDLYHGVSQVSQQPKVNITVAGGSKLTIGWEGSGTLQSTQVLQASGTVWTDVGTTNPMSVTPTGTAQFYRVRVP
jgi:Concanavalin A-like lectin/glucanases superfamily